MRELILFDAAELLPPAWQMWAADEPVRTFNPALLPDGPGWIFAYRMVGPDGRLRREELARHVFPDAARRRQLEAILHPRIRDRWQAQLAAWRAEGRPVAVSVIPLLFETGAEAQFDEIVCIACTAATQLARLRARGWTEEQIALRLAAQWPVQKKIERSHHVLWTEGDRSALAAQLACALG